MSIEISESNSDLAFDIHALRSILKMPRKSRVTLLYALANCSDEIQKTLLDLVAIADSPKSSDDEKAAAMAAIQETLHGHGCHRVMGETLDNIESSAAGRRSETFRVAEQFESQEKQFARKLRGLMRAKGLTQTELARRSECTQPAISQMLNRKCRPQKRTILKLAEGLGVAPTDLWPDLDVADILDNIAAVQTDQEPLSAEEAAAIDRATKRETPGPAGKPLPKLKQ